MEKGDKVRVTEIATTDGHYGRSYLKGIYNRPGRLEYIQHRGGGWYTCDVFFDRPLNGVTRLSFWAVKLEPLNKEA